MKKKVIVAVLAVVLLVGSFAAGTVFGAQNAEPGTQGDPLITLSYLESRLSELEKSLTGKTSVSKGSSGTASESASSASQGFVRLRLEKGQSITLADGGELVVYSGNGTVLGTTGMISLTGSELFDQGTSVVLYNHYMALGGASGVRATSAMIIYVKGEYTLKQGD